MSATPTLPRRDGHTHSQFCPHGSREATEQFIERAIALGFETYSLTEHPPLPRDFIDPTADHSCGMRQEDLEPYLLHAQKLKKRYAERIEIRVGLEVDYIPGYESDVRTMLNDYGSQMDDALLSVHFLEGKGGWRCVDLSPEDFQDGLIDVYGSVEAVHGAYWTFVKQAVEARSWALQTAADEPSKPRAQVSTQASTEEPTTLPCRRLRKSWTRSTNGEWNWIWMQQGCSSQIAWRSTRHPGSWQRRSNEVFPLSTAQTLTV